MYIRKSGDTLVCDRNKLNRIIFVVVVGVLLGDASAFAIREDDIGDEGARYLADFLKLNTSLSQLNISHNKIGDEGAQCLANAIKTNSSLQQLSISTNCIGDEGARYLADAIKINTSLQKLNISRNNIGFEGARYLGNALKINTSLQLLNISYNKVGSEGARYLADAINFNFFLQEFRFLDNNIHVPVTNKMERLMERNNNASTLTKIGMMFKNRTNGVRRDLRKARMLFERAKSMGDAEATIQLETFITEPSSSLEQQSNGMGKRNNNGWVRIDDIPVELWREIVSFVDFPTLLEMRLLCKISSSASNSDSSGSKIVEVATEQLAQRSFITWKPIRSDEQIPLHKMAQVFRHFSKLRLVGCKLLQTYQFVTLMSQLAHHHVKSVELRGLQITTSGESTTIDEIDGICCSLHRLGVVSIGLLRNGLKKLPDSIGSLTKLIHLDISSNSLTSLPDSIGSLTNLIHLDISSNDITSLSESIGSLFDLIHLDISCNKLESLPNSIFSLSNLTHLDISFNKLESLPNSIGSLTNLTHLDISCNHLESIPFECASVISQLGYFDFEFDGNPLSDIPHECHSDRVRLIEYLNR